MMAAPGLELGPQIHPQTFIRFVLAASEARRGARLVLATLLHSLDFETLTARTSRARLVELTGLTDKSVKAALAELRRAGEIEAVEYATGGRHRVPVYAFPRGLEAVSKRGEEPSPLSADSKTQKGGSLRPKGGKFATERGEVTTPPSLSLLVSKGRGRRAGRAAKGDKAPRGTPTADSRPVKSAEKDAAAWARWIEPLTHEGTSDGVATFRAPSRFHATYVSTHFADALLARWRQTDPTVRRITIAGEPAQGGPEP